MSDMIIAQPVLTIDKVQTGEVCGQRYTQTDMTLEDDDDFEVQNRASRTRQSTDVSQGHTEGQAPVTA